MQEALKTRDNKAFEIQKSYAPAIINFRKAEESEVSRHNSCS
jgi:hypothetical protein